MSEYELLKREFPSISVEVEPSKFDRGLPVLLIEAANIRPDNYDINNLRKFSRVISWNRRFLEIIKDQCPTTYTYGFPLFDNYYQLTEFLPVDRQIHGVSLIARKAQRQTTGDIAHLRELVFMGLQNITKHAYGKIPFCGEFYRGIVGSSEKETYPSSLAKLKKLNEYRFSLCFDNCYHELWSYDYMTEKIFDCFKAKTIPIYLGCFNVEDHIPTDLFIDARKFRSTEELSNYLIQMDEQTVSAMTERAYRWVQTCQWGSIPALKQLLTSTLQGSTSPSTIGL